MSMVSVEPRNISDAELAEMIRSQMARDLLGGQNVPPMQRMLAEAIARILDRPLVMLHERVRPGEMVKAEKNEVEGR
jgi:hypothetical protein